MLYLKLSLLCIPVFERIYIMNSCVFLGLLDSYKKLMTAAVQLVPLLEQLQNEHLNKFNLAWKVLNQHLYQSCVYTDPLVQNNVPVFIALVRNFLKKRF